MNIPRPIVGVAVLAFAALSATVLALLGVLVMED